MYFLYSNWYSKFMKLMLVTLLNQYDALLCEGKMAADLARKNGILKPQIYTTFLGVPKERYDKLLYLTPNLNSKNIIFLATGPAGWRTWYKGLDLMIEAFNMAFQISPELSFTIIGDWKKEVKNELLLKCTQEARDAIHFVGYVDGIESYFSKGALYLHCSRGDAFPTVVLEAIAAGLIPIVSEWTGSKEIIEPISSELIVKLNKNIIAEKIIWFMNLPIEEKEELSKQLRKTVKNYTEENALSHYKEIFQQIRTDFNI